MKKYPIVALLSAAAGGIAVLIIWLLHLASWWAVYALATLLLIPCVNYVVYIWDDYDCYDFGDFIEGIKIEQRIKDKVKNEYSDDDNNRII
jgi:hypothetical protein